MSTTELAPGANVAVLRKERGWSQSHTARKATVSVSLLSKIEVGDRALTPAVAAALARAFGVTMDEVLGRAPVAQEDRARLSSLRAAIRDYDLPDRQPVEEPRIGAALEAVGRYRDAVDVVGLKQLLPSLLRDATTHAHAANTAEAWMALAEVYSSVYWLAARHRWMDLAELAVARQRWAVEQKPNPLGEAVAARDRAGTYLNFGDVERGLTLVDRAIAKAQASLSGTDRDIAVSILNLRGMTLAGRLADKREAKREAQRHIDSAHNADISIGRDIDVHGLTVGPQNTFTHELATRVDLGGLRDALRMTDDLPAALAGLPPTRVAPTHINYARAQLDLGDRDGALENLGIAWDAAPQMARIHPMGREVFRVVSSLHRRSNTKLLKLSKLAGIEL
ncbi:helix-turn-helix transcriptional regulator [Streptomyces sp. 4503]|uniref:Helix-turn-helix transcriptional regulator n=1 Tax=Streptomyces niphimycinicus TaxID=2842201 RepID=A0ABS6CP47_9ACTN|nr:helix-turn-helix transcriptional regulator [Streptomyces niphimycinicus]MBU3868685.1 helix-turn-helix transcriptional regulator [Streptomyces niphimycinicus]